jgi:hypothetical protein
VVDGRGALLYFHIIVSSSRGEKEWGFRNWWWESHEWSTGHALEQSRKIINLCGWEQILICNYV